MRKIRIVDCLGDPLPVHAAEEVCGKPDSRGRIHAAHCRHGIASLDFTYRSAVLGSQFLSDPPHFSMEQWVRRLVNLRRDQMIVKTPQGGEQDTNVDSRFLRFAHVGRLYAGLIGPIGQLAFGGNGQIFTNDVPDLNHWAKHPPLMPLDHRVAERPVEKRQYFAHVDRHRAGRQRFHQLACKQRQRDIREAVIADHLVLMNEIRRGYEFEHALALYSFGRPHEFAARHRPRRNDDDESLGIRSAGATIPDIKRRRIGKVGLYFTFHQQLTRSLIVPTWPVVACSTASSEKARRGTLLTGGRSSMSMSSTRKVKPRGRQSFANANDSAMN